MTTEILDEVRESKRTLRPAPLPAKYEKKLNETEKRVLALARAGKRTEEMAGWSFRIGLQGISGKRAIQVRPWTHDVWLWVEWCESAQRGRTLEQPSSDRMTTGFDRL